MENSAPADRKKARKTAALIAGSIFGAFMAIYVITSIKSFSNKVDQVNAVYGFKRADNPKADTTLFTDSAYISLSRRNAWVKAKSIMADNDSVSFSISLPDSSAVLEINGVKVFSSRISGFALSRIFVKADEYALNNMLSKPFNIASDISTIEKEPLSHKVAPRDTSEFVPAEVPDTARKDAVNYILETDNGFRIYVFQQNENNLKRNASGFFFDLASRFRSAGELIKGTVKFSPPEYHPYIKITIPAKDARIIYRALPRKGQVALRR